MIVGTAENSLKRACNSVGTAVGTSLNSLKSAGAVALVGTVEGIVVAENSLKSAGEGALVGTADGIVVGKSVGNNDGISDGVADGASDDDDAIVIEFDGMSDGALKGASDGASDTSMGSSGEGCISTVVHDVDASVLLVPQVTSRQISALPYDDRYIIELTL